MIPPPAMRDNPYDPASSIILIRYGSQLSAATALVRIGRQSKSGSICTRPNRPEISDINTMWMDHLDLRPQYRNPKDMAVLSINVKLIPSIPNNSPPIIDHVQHPSLNDISRSPIYEVYFPVNGFDYGAHRILNGYHIGKLTVYSGEDDAFYSYIAMDHGQYPWGRSSSEGAMAFLTNSMGITPDTGVCNTCLATHLPIRLLQNRIVSTRCLLENFSSVMFNYFHSDETRVAEVAVPDFLNTIQVKNKVCIRIISHRSGDDFILLPEKYGNPNCSTMVYIVHSINHFFLAKPITPSRPDVPRPGSYESIDFGDPPVDFSDV